MQLSFIITILSILIVVIIALVCRYRFAALSENEFIKLLAKDPFIETITGSTNIEVVKEFMYFYLNDLNTDSRRIVEKRLSEGTISDRIFFTYMAEDAYLFNILLRAICSRKNRKG